MLGAAQDLVNLKVGEEEEVDLEGVQVWVLEGPLGAPGVTRQAAGDTEISSVRSYSIGSYNTELTL